MWGGNGTREGAWDAGAELDTGDQTRAAEASSLACPTGRPARETRSAEGPTFLPGQGADGPRQWASLRRADRGRCVPGEWQLTALPGARPAADSWRKPATRDADRSPGGEELGAQVSLRRSGRAVQRQKSVKSAESTH